MRNVGFEWQLLATVTSGSPSTFTLYVFGLKGQVVGGTLPNIWVVAL